MLHSGGVLPLNQRCCPAPCVEDEPASISPAHFEQTLTGPLLSSIRLQTLGFAGHGAAVAPRPVGEQCLETHEDDQQEQAPLLASDLYTAVRDEHQALDGRQLVMPVGPLQTSDRNPAAV